MGGITCESLCFNGDIHRSEANQLLGLNSQWRYLSEANQLLGLNYQGYACETTPIIICLICFCAYAL